MYKVQGELLLSCKRATERLIDLLIDELRRHPSEKKKLLKELSKAQNILEELKRYNLES
jgi:hypothetical protein